MNASAPRSNLDSVVERVRGPGEAGRWQGAPTQWALAHKEKQRGQRLEAPGQRACSAVQRSGKPGININASTMEEFR